MRVLKTVVLILAAAARGSSALQMEPSITNFEHPTWNQGSQVTAEDTIEVTFVVKTCPMRRAELEEKFWAVSDPKGPDYKKYLKLDEVADLLHPIKEGETLHADFIVNYLNEQEGLVQSTSVTKTRDLVTATLNAKAAEEFFGTQLFHYTPKLESYQGLDLIRANSGYSLPDELAEKVAIVDKLIRLPHLQDRKRDTSTSSLRRVSDDSDPFNSCNTASCSEATTPAVLKAQYGFPALSNVSSTSSMACAEFQFQGVKDSDLANFRETCGVDHCEVDITEGSGGSAMAGVEALLDVEYIEAVAAPIPLTVINSIQYSLFDWAQDLNNDDSPAWVQSVSYGNDEVQQTSVEYMNECNQQFQMNGARGLSVLFASGDQGVWGRTGHTTDGVFHPDFPAGSPYITAVGGTQFLTRSTLGEETTWADGGGGFSNTFAIPDYQASAVASYLASGVDLPDDGQYNATGRAYPDVSALAGTANGYCVAAKGRYEKVGGTSAACPVFAGHIAILNDMLLAQGDGVMGFLNPWIYGVAGPAGAFNDVTSGTNNAGFGNGFTATDGWDPATGFGTPNYAAMEATLDL
jgi:tripeptidyl-peptidase-1